MTIRVRCECGKQLPIKDEYAGRRIKCPDCQKSICVPKADVTDYAADLVGQFDSDDDYKPTRRSRKSNKKRGGQKSGLDRLLSSEALRSFAGWLSSSPFVLVIMGCVSVCILCALFPTTMTPICLVLAGVGCATMLFGRIWMIVATFRVSVGLGAFFILIGLMDLCLVAAGHPGLGWIVTVVCFLISIVLIIEHWQEFRGPVLCLLSGYFMLAIGVYFPLYQLASVALEIAQRHAPTSETDDASSRSDSTPLVRPPHTLKGHTGSVTGVWFSPDGTRLVSTSTEPDQSVKVWDVTSGQELLTLKEKSTPGGIPAYSPDGKLLAVSHFDKSVRIWDAASGQEMRSWKSTTQWIIRMAFSPDGSRLATGGSSPTVTVWDVASGEETLALKGYGGKLLAFSPDGTQLMGAHSDGTVKVWDATSGQETLTLELGTDEIIECMALSSDWTRMASSSALLSEKVKVWDATNGQEILRLNGPTGSIGYVASLAFSPDGNRLASAGIDSTVKVWDAKSGMKILEFNGHSRPVLSVAFSSDGKRLASAGADHTIKVWDFAP